MMECTGPDGRWHYDDWSCCHTLVPNAVVNQVYDLLTEMLANDYPNGNEYAAFMDRMDKVVNDLPERVKVP